MFTKIIKEKKMKQNEPLKRINYDGIKLIVDLTAKQIYRNDGMECR